MPRKPLPGPSRLSKILAELTKPPRPTMGTLKSLKLTLAAKNDHFGARHFVKSDLPRIRYANPAMEIQVNKIPKSPQDSWKPEMVLEFRDGTKRTLDVAEKWSSTIMEELLNLAGGASWERWKRERKAQGLPMLDVPAPKAPKAPHASRVPKATKAPKKADTEVESLLSQPWSGPNAKTGAAAVLP